MRRLKIILYLLCSSKCLHLSTDRIKLSNNFHNIIFVIYIFRHNTIYRNQVVVQVFTIKIPHTACVNIRNPVLQVGALENHNIEMIGSRQICQTFIAFANIPGRSDIKELTAEEGNIDGNLLGKRFCYLKVIGYQKVVVFYIGFDFKAFVCVLEIAWRLVETFLIWYIEFNKSYFQ